MNRYEKVTLYRSPGIVRYEWRWKWQARNGRIIAASTEGYAAKRDCIANLKRVTGGVFEVTFQMRDVRGGMYQQGVLILNRFDDRERLFVEVLP